MKPNPQETADLVIFTEKILIGKLYFCAVWDTGQMIRGYLAIASKFRC